MLVASGTAHVADAQQRLDVRVVRVFVQRIDDEEDGVDLPLHDPAGHLHIAPQRARAEALDRNADFVGQQIAGGAGGDQIVERAGIQPIRD